jgi:hypothetical protein
LLRSPWKNQGNKTKGLRLARQTAHFRPNKSKASDEKKLSRRGRVELPDLFSPRFNAKCVVKTILKDGEKFVYLKAIPPFAKPAPKLKKIQASLSPNRIFCCYQR